MILALDLGTHTGWALHDGASVVDSGVWDFTPRKGEGPITRVAAFHGRLRGMLHTYQPDRIAFEQNVFMPKGATAGKVRWQLETVLLLEAHYRGLPVVPLGPGAVKRHATGKGNADKSLMAVAAARHWPGWMPAREDEVDARWIAEAAVAGVTVPERRRRARRTLGEAA